MKFLCEICCFDNSNKHIQTLYIDVEMPAVMPLGTHITLPTPRSWSDPSGHLSGSIAGYQVVAGLAIVNLKVDSWSWSLSDLHELARSGYTLGLKEPEQLKAAYDAMTLDPIPPVPATSG